MTPTIEVHGPDDLSESDRATITANGIVVDVIAREDGTVYVETYAVDGRRHQAVVSSHFVDCYTVTHPNLTLRLADRP